MEVKKADMGYIDNETREFLNTPFVFEAGDFGGVATAKEGTKVTLIYAPDWEKWIYAMYDTAFATWNNGYEINLDEIAYHNDVKKLTLDFIKKRPISAVYESAMFVIKIDNIPRALTHQIVRHRKMSFNQESFRVTPAHHADFRIPEGLTQEQKDAILDATNNARSLYVQLINSGIPTEQARNVLGMGTCTHIVMTTNLSALREYINARTLDITQDEHTFMVMLIVKELRDKAPEFYENFIKSDKLEEMMKQYEV